MRHHHSEFTSRLLSGVAGAALYMVLPFSSVSEVSASPVVGLEKMRTSDSVHAAAKALNLNTGEPRTVRMIYFLPNDRPFRQEVVDSMKVTIRQVQTFYGDQMEAHGHGRKTFRFETDAQGEPLVHRVDGEHPDSHYLDQTLLSAVGGETALAFDLEANIYFIVIDNSTGWIHQGGGVVFGVGGSHWKNGGYVLVPGSFSGTTVAHELGHACGLNHDFRDRAYIMSYGPGEDRLSACSAEYLAVNTYFNPDIPIEETSSPTIEHINATRGLTSRQQYPPGSTSVSVQFKVSDSDGLHQVQLFGVTREPHSSAGAFELIACRGLEGETEAIVEFEYDGGLPTDDTSTSLSDIVEHWLGIRAIDRHGNHFGTQDFILSETSGVLPVKLDGDQGAVSIAFSPDGTMLAIGEGKVWDVKTRQIVATFPPDDLTEPTYVAFSPDGAILANGAKKTNLWDIATQTKIATLEVEEFVWPRERYVIPMAFSHAGAMLASSSHFSNADGYYFVVLWDVKTRQRIATLSGHETFVRSVAFSPDDRILAAPSGKTIKLWDLRTMQPVATLEGHEEEVKSVAFSPDGTMLVSGSRDFSDTMTDDEAVKVWDVKTKQVIATFAPTGGAETVAFSPDGALLASSQDPIELWDVKTKQPVATFRGHTHLVRSMAFSPDGTTLASVDFDGNVLLWDMSEYVTPVAIIPDLNLRAAIRDALGKPPFAPITVPDMARLTVLDASNRHIRELGGLELATGLTDLNLEGNPLSSSATTRQIPALQESGVAVLFDDISVILTLSKLSGDGQQGPAGVQLADPLVVSVLDQEGNGVAGVTVRFTVTSDGTLSAPTATTDTDGRAATTLTLGSEPGTNIVTATVAGLDPVYITATVTNFLATLEGHTLEGRHGVESISFSPDGAMLATRGTYDSASKVWDVKTQKIVATFDTGTKPTYVAFSPDGAILAYGARETKLWDIATQTQIATLEQYVVPIAFSHNGAMLATASTGGDADGWHVVLWDMNTRQKIATLAGHETFVEPVSFSPDDRILVAASKKTIKLWNLKTKQPVATLEGHKEWVESVSFSPDGTLLASGSRTDAGTDDETVKVWDVKTKQVVAAFSPYWGADAVAFSPDGAILASNGDEESSIELWDVRTNQPVASLRGHNAFVKCLAFSPDGATLASGDVDGNVLLWDMSEFVTPVAIIPDLNLRAAIRDALGKQPFAPITVIDMEGLTALDASNRNIRELGGLELAIGLTDLNLEGNSLSSSAITTHIPALRERGVAVLFDGIPVISTLTKLSGDGQQGAPGTALADPLVVSVLDEDGNGVAGTSVTFAVTAGGGTLSATTVTTDVGGRAAATLTLGSEPGANTVTAAAAGLDPVTFTAAAAVSTDFDGDTVTGLSDFFLFADAFGGSDPRFDLDRDGSVGFGDFFLLADRFAEPERGKLLALARELIGLPDGPQLRQNAPNPFNSETVISWFLLRPGPARVEVFSLTGQRVAVLREGPEKAGVHRIRWDGRDDRGRPLASGVYLYRLATEESVQTRKLTLLR